MNKERVDQCVAKIRKVTDFQPDIALILGSGLGALAERIKDPVMIDYHEIPGFPVSTVQGHKGRFIFGYLGNAKVVVMQGRVHYYE
ncbi:MAG: purine-nucleoside phosphorylase, partial [Eubacterium sp.]|nr:purine-nucleoside phosphorylase [Eubacterium sp.]